MWILHFLAIKIAYAALHGSRALYMIKETHYPSSQWTNIGTTSEDLYIHLEIALRSTQSLELERHLLEVSDPLHHRYGQHLSAEQVNALVAPEEPSIVVVEEWLRDHNIINFDYNEARDWLRTGPVHIRTVEYLLDTTYYIFAHEDDGATAIRTPKWSLPMHLHEHIDTIQPTTSFFQLRRSKKPSKPRPPFISPERLTSRAPRDEYNLGDGVPTYRELEAEDIEELGHIPIPSFNNISSTPTISEACNRIAISPLCISVLYKTYGYVPQVPEKGRMGIVNYLGEITNVTDVNEYLQRYRPDISQADVAREITTKAINQMPDANLPSDPHQIKSGIGLEAALDTETVIGLTHPIPVTTYSVGGRPPFKPTKGYESNINEPYLDWVQYMLSLPDAELPQVVTTSYGEPEQTVPPSYARRVCQGFAQLGARGVSLIFASGDQGVGRDGECVNNDGSNTPILQPDFPGGCPFITAVGGTRELGPEIAGFNARTSYVTGGGFSSYFPRPEYQKTAVDTYLNHRLQPQNKLSGLFDRQGRGIPDVAATSYQLAIVHQGESHLSDGTSAASPTFAAVIALLNDALMAEGRPPLGFLNPWLYSDGWKGLRDVVYGSNHGCNTTGFPASEGWDPVTGLGTPNFQKLKDLALEYRFRKIKPWYYLY